MIILVILYLLIGAIFLTIVLINILKTKLIKEVKKTIYIHEKEYEIFKSLDKNFDFNIKKPSGGIDGKIYYGQNELDKFKYVIVKGRTDNGGSYGGAGNEEEFRRLMGINKINKDGTVNTREIN